MSAPVERPPTRTYEVRTCHNQAYCAEGDVIETRDGWLTIWADEHTVALRIPEADIRALRQLDDYGDVDPPQPVDPKLAHLVLETLGIEWNLESGQTPDYQRDLYTACHQLQKSEAAREHLRNERDQLKQEPPQVKCEMRFDEQRVKELIERVIAEEIEHGLIRRKFGTGRI